MSENGKILTGLIFIGLGIFIIYAVIISTNKTVQAWGYLLLGIILIWWAYNYLITAFALFRWE